MNKVRPLSKNTHLYMFKLVVIRCNLPLFMYLSPASLSVPLTSLLLLIMYATLKQRLYSFMVHISVKFVSLTGFYETYCCETEGLLGLHILCMVSFLPFGECGQCKFNALPHFLAWL